MKNSRFLAWLMILFMMAAMMQERADTMVFNRHAVSENRVP